MPVRPPTRRAATTQPRTRAGTRRSARPRELHSIDPATGERLATFRALTLEELAARVARAAEAFRRYRRTSFPERAHWLTRAAEVLDERIDELARLITREMGKPVRASGDEIRKCARACRFYAEHAEAMLADRPVATEASRSFVRFAPLGPVLAVMPWNFPFWQVFRFAAPALMAGNVALLKHASNVPQCAVAIERVFIEAGYADGVFQTLLIGAAEAEALLDDERVAAVTLTGSEAAGRAVASRAGARLKKSVLELGGSDPFVVLPSADVARAARVGVTARVVNNGQSCIAAKRFIVADAVADEFTRRFVEGMQALRVGHPLDPETEVGPLATADILDTLDEQVTRTVRTGARVLTGGERLEGAGNYYMPTVITDVPEDSPAYREELFGPVAVLVRARDADHALAIANDTPFGLGASVWTRDPAERARFVDEIESGLVFVNEMVASDPRLPFGGVKRSGYGRELSEIGPREFTNVKTVWIRDGDEGGGAGTE
jgi:succinate-semialdehyde dehydrogenase/glutarate-semialdehyde dehydrogenase